MYENMKEEYANENDNSDNNDLKNSDKNGDGYHMKFRKRERNPHMAFLKFFFYVTVYLVLRQVQKYQEEETARELLEHEKEFPEPRVIFSDNTPGQAPKKAKDNPNRIHPVHAIHDGSNNNNNINNNNDDENDDESIDENKSGREYDEFWSKYKLSQLNNEEF